MQTVLLTGFEPFGGETVNPSWEAVRRLDGAELGGARVFARRLPCVFGAALAALDSHLAELRPELAIAVGQAGGRPDITVERVAINVDDARIADNAGRQPIDQPIAADGPAAYFATLPIKAIVAGLRAQGIPASVSQTAGTFVCNHVMYGLLHRRVPRAGFIHIPYLPEQAAGHPGAPSMALDDCVAALRLAVELALAHRHDLALAGGATH
ncbi:pyroglutamyl-peptidase I [Chromobacterium subtsugae]|mgnify:CR=1 FL=1|uniref:Pyrrolidone-carboxylate peptidase n=1 Tax=Chromobacterium subtsugae TaxID=251747 RepID=A0ABS7FH49_9NEIS|nr:MULTISPECIES: pyroglutamyl-peptidase I [Chromobacterium]KUM01629.1 pyrrolidone-carboxylate peptidase [Chromobacterium subtsugae]KZE87278.1 pyrrolidone-carboxylate peptidase [Chromobacterium sp. F49]MBW7568323.1 pyroglutamyl-peptidase I [Chromobacterium subtsugae]MBW8289413.1 pyroglutamyl-peptidase I [Chromobacterium subtsugae]OBU88063.1 pyrrolidone-carboxylate peptidase [Chromobacterium subtsugae]